MILVIAEKPSVAQTIAALAVNLVTGAITQPFAEMVWVTKIIHTILPVCNFSLKSIDISATQIYNYCYITVIIKRRND